MSKVKSTGGSTSYYIIPESAKEIHDLIDHKKMNYSIANIFKACYRLGEKEGAEEIYDLQKIIHFAQRELNKLQEQQAVLEKPLPASTIEAIYTPDGRRLDPQTSYPVAVGVLPTDNTYSVEIPGPRYKFTKED